MACSATPLSFFVPCLGCSLLRTDSRCPAVEDRLVFCFLFVLMLALSCSSSVERSEDAVEEASSSPMSFMRRALGMGGGTSIRKAALTDVLGAAGESIFEEWKDVKKSKCGRISCIEGV